MPSHPKCGARLPRGTGAIFSLMATLIAGPVLADSTKARCDIYPAGDDHTDKVMPCRFYQAQGHVVITRSDGVEHDLIPDPEAPATYSDQNDDPVYREDGLGDQGLIFRFPQESVYVYWTTASLESERERMPYEPAVDLAFDATAWTRCRAISEPEFGQCPSGVLRREGGEGSVVIEDPPGETFTINFMKNYVNASNREVNSTLEGDVWTVIVDGEKVYEVSRALIEGG